MRIPRIRPGGAVIAALLLAVCGLSATTAATSGGFRAAITDPTNTAGTATYFTCATAVGPGADGPSAVFAWPLDETSGTSAADVSGHGVPGTYSQSPQSASGAPACPRDPGSAYRLNGSSDSVSPAATAATSNPKSISLEIWFRSTAASGMLVGFGKSRTGASASVDRMLYLSSAGRLVFGLDPGTKVTLTSPQAYVDGAWHHVVATSSSAAGSRLYVDGVSVASDASMTTGRNGSGYWRVGYDDTSGWPGAGPDPFFTGALRYAAVYSTALSASQVASHFAAGR